MLPCNGNYHELNVDWLICRIKETLAEWAQMEKEFDNLNDAFLDLKEYVTDYFKNLDVQDEINNKLEEMFNDGKLNEILNLFIPYVTPEMFNAKGDGVTDDYNAFVNAANTKKPIILKPNTTYLISLPVTIYNSLYGNNSSIIYTNNDIENGKCCIELEKVKNCIINNISIKGSFILSGAFTSSEYCGAIGIRGCENVIIENVYAENMCGDGIAVSRSTDASVIACKNISINNLISINC